MSSAPENDDEEKTAKHAKIAEKNFFSGLRDLRGFFRVV
jgi:hypothetical protein